MAMGFLQRQDLNALLQRKYDILQQGANADTLRAQTGQFSANTERMGLPSQIGLRQSQSGLFDVQAQTLPGDVASQIQSRDASARYDVARTDAVNRLGAIASDDALGAVFSGAGFTNPPSQGFRQVIGDPTLTASGVGFAPYQPDDPRPPIRSITPMRPGGLTPMADKYRAPTNIRTVPGATPLDEDGRRMYAKGTHRVPGKGSGLVDKVDAKLAPGEAILNKAAAEMLGRGLIKKLNEMGASKMGMV